MRRGRYRSGNATRSPEMRREPSARVRLAAERALRIDV